MADDLKELQQAFTSDDADWKDHKDAREESMKALGPDSTWDEKERKARKAEGRPCLSFDEVGQYVNQLVNDAREQERAVDVSPGPEDEDDAEARFVSAHIREIEQKSNAQLAYTRMFEDAASGGYGFVRIVAEYAQDAITDDLDGIGPEAFEQELRIKPIHNPDLVTPGYFTQPDFSDAERFWIHERVTHAEFKRRWPDAEVQAKDVSSVGGVSWGDHKAVWVRECWQKKSTRRRLALLPAPGGAGDPVGVWVDTIPKEQRKAVLATALRERWVEVPKITQLITNGAEVLEEERTMPGRYLPIIGCTGKILWVGDKRHLMSLIRKAIDPQQVLNYYRTSEAEMASMAPKFPWFHYEGSLDAKNAGKLANANRKPVGSIAIKPKFEGWSEAWGPVPFPSRNPYEPPIQAFEVGAESTRRAIQAATGTGFLPTEAPRQNQKSGVALRESATSASKGAYHFVDNYEHAIRHVGVVLVDYTPHYYDTPRNLHVRGKDNAPIRVRINDENANAPQELGGKPIMLKKGQRLTVTVSTGPSYATEREKASEFADQLVTGRPETFVWFADLIFKLKQIGPLGDKMAERAKAMLPPAIQALENGQQANPQVQQMQAQLKQAQQVIQQLQRILETEQIKGQAALELKKLDGDIRMALADLAGKQKLQQIAATVAADIDTREDEQAHEVALAGADAAKSEADAERAEYAADKARIFGTQTSS